MLIIRRRTCCCRAIVRQGTRRALLDAVPPASSPSGRPANVSSCSFTGSTVWHTSTRPPSG